VRASAANQATWGRVEGLPGGISRNIDTYQVIPVTENHAVVVIEDTDLYMTEDAGRTWARIPKSFPRIYTVLAL
jgi:photosystem II stability/assembly factor-like uncharacterized protein